MALIYVVEDDASIRGELLQVLERNGYETRWCERFDTVVDEVLAASPDLVLLDLTLPGTDGQFICRELRAVSSVPIMDPRTCQPPGYPSFKDCYPQPDAHED